MMEHRALTRTKGRAVNMAGRISSSSEITAGNMAGRVLTKGVERKSVDRGVVSGRRVRGSRSSGARDGSCRQTREPRRVEAGPGIGQLQLRVTDAGTGKPTFCRVNVVGSDGNYYQPAQNYLTKYNMVGRWPKTGWGNREGKAPWRYYGHYFYFWGEGTLQVPTGKARIEVWKGAEYQPHATEAEIVEGETVSVSIELKNE